MATAYSSLHSQKPPRRLTQKLKPPPPAQQPMPMQGTSGSSASLDHLSTSRTSSLAGRKRPRESDGDSTKIIPRRTKSVGDQARNRELFQRSLIAVFVPAALRDAERGDLKGYNELLDTFQTSPGQSPPSLVSLYPLVRTLAANVSHLSSVYHRQLVTVIINLPWATGDEKFARCFIGWAGVLISARPEWTKEMLTMAVKGLTWQFTTSSSITRSQFHARHHLLLRHLLSLVPTLPNTLGPLLVRHFPHKREREVVQTTYVRNICEVTDYCPEIGARIWSEVVDRMIRIDVEITKADDEDDDRDDDERGDGDEARLLSLMKGSDIKSDPFLLRLDEDVPLDPIVKEDREEEEEQQDIDDLSSADGSVSGDEEVPDAMLEALAKARRKLNVFLNRRKLDGMLHYFIIHLAESMGYRSSSPPAAQLAASNLGSGQSTPTNEIAPITAKPPRTPAESLAAFQTLLNLFLQQILQTSSTQHIPFLLFVASSYSPAHTDLFLGLLVSLSLYGTSSSTASQVASQNQRIAATVYIGSIVCRARFVTDDQARQVMKYLLAYIDGKMHQAKTSRPDEMPLFYAVCQAVMLIFCFRWRAFTRDDEEGVVGEIEMDDVSETENGRWMMELEVLQQVITSDLNPLLGCNSTIVQTFAKVAHQVNFAYCFSILESNASAARSTSTHSLSALSRPSSTPGVKRQGSSYFSRPVHASAAGTPNLALPREARKINVDSGFDSYFPFDPFDLPRAGNFVDPLYRTWGEVMVDADYSDEEDDDDDEEEEEEGEGDSDEEGTASELDSSFSPRRTLKIPSSLSSRMGGGQGSSSLDRRRVLKDGGLSTSFDGMSISPMARGLVQEAA